MENILLDVLEFHVCTAAALRALLDMLELSNILLKAFKVILESWCHFSWKIADMSHIADKKNILLHEEWT